jgi:hypothetical protein
LDDRGTIAIMTAVAFVPLALMLALVVDAGRVWVARERLQNGVESAALATAAEWSSGLTGCSASAMEFVTADGSTASSRSCSTSGGRTSGVVTVSATEKVGLMFAKIVGRSTSRVVSTARVRIGGVSSAQGLWPFGLCADNSEISAWIAAGFPIDTHATITFEQPSQLCGGSVPGNWAILDFNGGSSSNSETQGWALSGYWSPISVGDIVGGSPGAPSNSLDLAGAIGKTILFPLYRYPQYSGSNARYTIVGFATARVDAVRFSGASAQRSISITFKTGTVANGASTAGAGNFGLVTWSACSFDGYGVCS